MARMSARKLGELSLVDDAALLVLEANPYSTLPAAGNRMFETAYNRHIAQGESKKAAAIHAWMHVKHYYVQDPVTKKWTKRKKPLPFSDATKRRRRTANPRKGVSPQKNPRRKKERPKTKKRASKKNPTTLRSILAKALR